MPIHPNARQCAYTMVNGVRCGGPAWEEFPHCYHHHGLKSRFANKTMSIPPLDDQNAVQVAIMDALNGMLSGRLNRGDTYALLYGIHIARTNLKGLTLVPPPPETIAEMLAAARAEGRAEAEKAHEEEPESLAEHLFRALGEEMDEAGQAHVNQILASYGKPPITPRAPNLPPGPASPAPAFDPNAEFDLAAGLDLGESTRAAAALDPDSVPAAPKPAASSRGLTPELLAANSWDKKKLG